ncbi:MAG: flavodoxin domain-containing protein [Corynebacterium sp.]|uniref:flavodoxin domain-containing protein n=1 Tax=Corynebacterium sp. TaxID=1720 RepID=UPI0026DF3979|nr:flavodoxin domain-containing protein [Corynebacterium sp.]MDO5668553.1 flavodoxin domain-containing protein [Corynebacterium sp.]
MATVCYESAYGSTREYADALAQRLGTQAIALADATAPADPHDPLIVLSYVHGPVVPAASFVSKQDLGGRPVAVCAVGMTLLDVARAKDQLKGQVPEGVARFYLPGRLNYSTMSRKHKMIMWGIIKALKAKREADRSPNEQAMIDSYDRDTDRVDLSELDPIVEWVHGAGSCKS